MALIVESLKMFHFLDVWFLTVSTITFLNPYYIYLKFTSGTLNSNLLFLTVSTLTFINLNLIYLKYTSGILNSMS